MANRKGVWVSVRKVSACQANAHQVSETSNHKVSAHILACAITLPSAIHCGRVEVPLEGKWAIPLPSFVRRRVGEPGNIFHFQKRMGGPKRWVRARE